MKTQAEIVLKAKEYAESIGSKDGTCMYDYAMGYNQCQEDMLKLMKDYQAWIFTTTDTLTSFKKWLELNKQD